MFALWIRGLDSPDGAEPEQVVQELLGVLADDVAILELPIEGVHELGQRCRLGQSLPDAGRRLVQRVDRVQLADLLPDRDEHGLAGDRPVHEVVVAMVPGGSDARSMAGSILPVAFSVKVERQAAHVGRCTPPCARGHPGRPGGLPRPASLPGRLRVSMIRLPAFRGCWGLPGDRPDPVAGPGRGRVRVDGRRGSGCCWASAFHAIDAAQHARLAGGAAGVAAHPLWRARLGVLGRESVNGLLPVARLGGEAVAAGLLIRRGSRSASVIASLVARLTPTLLTQSPLHPAWPRPAVSRMPPTAMPSRASGCCCPPWRRSWRG
ncbi:MAG: hypothetical protein MZV49_00305 [Rhodopseudomonas palustris]|nr:hypothetical protein [Rhodopseudomonas palustris]